MATVHADSGALRALHDALVRFRHAQLAALDSDGYRIETAQASLKAKELGCLATLERSQADLDAYRGQAAEYARAVSDAAARLDHVRRWQRRIDTEASEFRRVSDRLRALLQTTLPHAEVHLLAMIDHLGAARRLQAPDA